MDIRIKMSAFVRGKLLRALLHHLYALRGTVWQGSALMMQSESLRRDIIGERQALVPRASEAGFDGDWWALRGYPFGPVVNWEKAGCG